MKKITLIFSIFSVLLFSCSKEDPTEFNQKMTDPYQLSISETTIPESGGDIKLELNVEQKEEGVLFYAVSFNELAEPSNYQIITGDVDAFLKGRISISEGFNSAIDTLPGSENYYVYSVFRSIEDAVSPVSIDTVKVNDVTGPYIIGEMSNPMNGGLTNVFPKFSLYFNEDVTVADKFTMVVNSIYEEEGELPVVTKTVSVSTDDILISGNVVNVDLSDIEFPCGNKLIVSAIEGAFTDNTGNSSDAIGWIHDGNEFVSIDYYFEMIDDRVNDTMQLYLGANTAMDFFDGTISSGSYQWDVELKQCTESTVLLEGYFGVHEDLEFTFDLDKGIITFEEYATSIYFDSNEGTFKLIGEGQVLDPSFEHRAFYMPASTESGEYSITQKTFYVTYNLVVENLGTFGSVLTNYSKNPTNTSAATASTQSVSIDSKYSEAVKKFKNR